MKFDNEVRSTYRSYLEQVWGAGNRDGEEEIKPLLKQFHASGSPDQNNMSSAFLVIDYSKRKYALCTDGLKNVLGYHQGEVLEGGLDFTISLVQKDYFKMFNENVFACTTDFLKGIPQADHHNYTFSVNTRMKSASGKYINVLQKSVYITSKETSLPLYCLATLVDISNYKIDHSIVHSIHRADSTVNPVLVDSNYFYLNEEDTFLTSHEKNIIKWMADGLSSKMIAGKLLISENTISNHRQNMLRKTNTKNVAHLVAYALRRNII